MSGSPLCGRIVGFKNDDGKTRWFLHIFLERVSWGLVVKGCWLWKMALWGLGSFFDVSRSLLGPVVDTVLGLVGSLGDPLGVLWAILGAMWCSWSAVGIVLGSMGRLVGALWACLAGWLAAWLCAWRPGFGDLASLARTVVFLCNSYQNR